MSLAALHGCTAAKHRFKDRRHGKKIYNSITLESETCGAAEQALTRNYVRETSNLFHNLALCTSSLEFPFLFLSLLFRYHIHTFHRPVSFFELVQRFIVVGQCCWARQRPLPPSKSVRSLFFFGLRPDPPTLGSGSSFRHPLVWLGGENFNFF